MSLGVPILLIGGSAFLFCSGLQLIGWGSPTLGRKICFTQSPESNVNLIQKHPHRQTQNVWPTIGAPCGRVKLTHKINHHKTQNPFSPRDSYLSHLSARGLVLGDNYVHVMEHRFWFNVRKNFLAFSVVENEMNFLGNAFSLIGNAQTEAKQTLA